MNIFMKLWVAATLATSNNPKREFAKMIFFYLFGMAIAIISLIYFPTVAVILMGIVLIVGYIKEKLFG